MSVWQDADDDNTRLPVASMSDVIFKIDCRQLPADHAAVLTEALCQQAPWLHKLDHCGVHPIHVAGSQNGWQRPEPDSDEPLILSKRTRLRIRVQNDHAQKLIDSLSETRHQISGYQLDINSARINPLRPCETLFSRYTVYSATHTQDENAFLQQVMDECSKLGYTPAKLLCGRSQIVSTAAGKVTTRSVLLADVPAEYSIALQDKGLGDFRLMGCGLMIPHKDTGVVS